MSKTCTDQPAKVLTHLYEAPSPQARSLLASFPHPDLETDLEVGQSYSTIQS
jgi:hypothetical protein